MREVKAKKFLKNLHVLHDLHGSNMFVVSDQ